MPWDPDQYNQFKTIRYKPFFDLMNLISAEGLKCAVDIGCGTGEQTAILAQRFERTNFTGIDASAEMLEDSKHRLRNNLQYILQTIEDFAAEDSQWDLIFSNAALQWADGHETLFPQLISKLHPGGQFAVQMPFQPENVLNKILLEIVTAAPFADLLKGYQRVSPVLSVDEYTTLFFENDLQDLNMSLRVYPIIAASASELYSFISGSALIPYMERLDADGQALLQSEFLKRIADYFPKFPAIYPFKRLLLYGKKG